MYKVFVNDKPIILTDSVKKSNNFSIYNFKDVEILEIVGLLEKEPIKGIVLYCDDLKADWKLFQKKFKVVSAAGGLVLNPKNDILFIYRDKVWDLPKGKIEANETIEDAALREVKEECGVKELGLVNFLTTTYHIFYRNKKYQLKISHWFLMKTNDQQILIPQIEEGITKVEFKNTFEVRKALQNTYANIKLVIKSYKQTQF